MTDMAQDDCANDEALLEFQLLPTPRSIRNAPRYRAGNLNGTTIYFECVDCQYEASNNKTDIKLCLPKEECHRLSVGKGSGRNSGYYHYAEDDGEEDLFTLKWRGETLRRSNAYLFDTVDFGNCQAKCSPDQSEFEFYLAEDANAGGKLLSWNLTTSTNTSNALVRGEVPSNTYSFTYISECVPRDACLVFTMGYPLDMPTGFYDTSPFSVRLDGVMYRDHILRMGFSLGEKLNETVHLGQCQVGALCNETTQSLFEAEFRSEETYKPTYAEIPFDAIELTEFPFYLNRWDRNVLFFFDGIEVNTSYKIFDCIPKNECTRFCIGNNNDVESYTVKENGVERPGHVLHTSGYYEGATTTGLGTCSPSPNHRPESVGSSTILGIVMFFFFFRI